MCLQIITSNTGICQKNTKKVKSQAVFLIKISLKLSLVVFENSVRYSQFSNRVKSYSDTTIETNKNITKKK